MNILIGPNGAGKTSILEAVDFASTLRSFRRAPDASMITDTAERGFVRVGFAAGEREGRIEIELPRAGRRRVQLNGKRPPSNAALAREFATVAFLPDDLDLVKGGPGIRRDFIDDVAARLTPRAGAVQGEYARILRQRNALLRRDGSYADRPTLDVWDEQLAASGAELVKLRMEVIERLRVPLGEGYRAVAGAGELRIRYESSWIPSTAGDDIGSLTSGLAVALQDRRRRDMEMRSTSAGPHRDEPWFELNDRPARREASQGEQRSVALGSRLATYELLEQRSGTVPVLLLDDVFSELDPTRAEGVMELLPRGQVFVTSARDDEVPLSGRRWNVSAGSAR